MTRQRRRRPYPQGNSEQGTKEEKLAQAKAAALRLLRYRARTQRELLSRLQAKGWSGSVAQRVVARFKKVGLVDDRAFAEALVQSALTDTKPHSRREVQHKLRVLGVPDDLADEALALWTEETERQMAERYLQKRLQNRQRATQREVARAFKAAVQKGFAFTAVRDALRAFGVASDEP